MPTFLTLPREVRANINRVAMGLDKAIPLFAVRANGTGPKATFIIVQDTQSFNDDLADVEQVNHAVATLRNLQGTSKQVHREATEDFYLNNDISIRVMTPGAIMNYTPTCVNWSVVLKFNDIIIMAGRAKGLFLDLGGGPDLKIRIRTAVSKSLINDARELADGKALSADNGAMVLAKVASRQPGRIFDEDLAQAFIYAMEHFGSRR